MIYTISEKSSEAGKMKKKKVGQLVKVKYHVFSFYGRKDDVLDTWHYMGKFDTKEDAEEEMTRVGEPEGIQYMVIKGDMCSLREGPTLYPMEIDE